MKILYITHDGLTDPLGQSQVLPYLVGLSRLGHSIFILSCEKPAKFEKLGAEIRAICEQSSIDWQPLRYRNSPAIIGTLLNIRQLRSNANKICRDRKIEIVHCRSYIASLAGISVKRRLGVKYIFDMRGFWADERVEGGLWNIGQPLYRLIYSYFKKKEREFLQTADHIVTLTEASKRVIGEWNVAKSPITVIPTCTDLSLFNVQHVAEHRKTEMQERLGLLPTDFILLYHGSWGTWYMNNEMLDFFSELKRHKPAAKWVIATQDEVNLDGYPDKRDVVTFNCARNEVPVIISMASLCLFFIRPSFSKTASMPTKLGELIAMRSRLVTNKGVGDIEDILRGYDGAFLINEFSPPEYKRAITSQLAAGNRSTGDDSLRMFFSLDKGIERYNEIYREVGAGE